ncbi:MAG TPA: amidase family protein [Micropepsaceae bacterium]|nr:amidase family protein [Micropepsaceae bacterium]
MARALLLVSALWLTAGTAAAAPLHLEEASIADVHRAMLAHELTTTQLVTLYLKRIDAYNGRCVDGGVDPATGLQLGGVTPKPKAGQLNAVITVNRRGQRSRTDRTDADPAMPDALEAARALDADFARTGKLSGPLHGIPFIVKDQFDTFDMRTTAGAAADYANDRPPRDAEVVARLRKAGAIILGKGNMGEYASGDRSTFGGLTCNPYDTSRSAGRSSGGPGAAVAANLTMCGIGEETGPSTRNPAANESLVGIVATHSLVSRAGIIPASLTRDRAGILCRNVADAAAVLSAIAGYDPADPATADSVGHLPAGGYIAFANGASLQGMRIGVVREFMQVFTQADANSVGIAEQAIADLKKAGATIIDPGPKGALFAQAIGEIVPALDAPTLVELSRQTPAPDLTIRLLADREPPTSGEVLFAMDRYLTARGDGKIRSVRDLLDHSVFYDHPPIDGVTLPPKTRLEMMLRDAKTPDISRWHETRTVLQMLVNKVMADSRLDALVYPTKTIPAPRLAAPVEPPMVGGRDFRAPLTPRLSPNAGLPAIVVPAGFTHEVYDRIALRETGRLVAGELDGPKPDELPVAIEFLGRAYSEPVLIRIAAGYEQATHHRRAPADFPALPGEP